MNELHTPPVPIPSATVDPVISQKKRDAVGLRWQAVREERERWIQPFLAEKEGGLPVERALEYLEDLRNICEEGGSILNERINGDKNIKCAGPECGIDLSGVRPNGMPRWISKMDIKDERNPTGKGGRTNTRPYYFCSELCWNAFQRRHQGAMGNEAHK